ncbi:SLA/LP autoantigen-like protein [Trypanosoma grayi]|uniref:SLA/LP autoantigen-like protein n=1 Tax=Trypanosoma grayi TaxID=71804 RepID=UPI0004F4169E|nr:SLA/LP autoantigen-like protein [Trypanosoma grayi]KEG07091.1 SLA/LP autoantigen-like protein [Trypanosoma grayi]
MALGIPHVVNNAYGVQSRVIMRRLDAAIRLGRVDAVVQSGDKNFLVPVGGAVLSGKKRVVARVAEIYAGRASISPVVDLFITALSLGHEGFKRLWEERYSVRELLEQELNSFALARGEVVLTEDVEKKNVVEAAAVAAASAAAGVQAITGGYPRNDISFAVTMRTLGGAAEAEAVGARLFRSAVTGPRVVVPKAAETHLCGLSFRNYGMHTDETPPCPLLVMACGIGMTKEDVSGVIGQLEKAWPAGAVQGHREGVTEKVGNGA